MIWLLLRGVWETLAMTFVSGFFGFVLGLPVGVLLYVTRPGQIAANAKLYRTLSALVNIFRSIPFIILLVWMIPSPRELSYVHRPAGGHCAADGWRRAVYRPHGWRTRCS
jgi:ABC-type methionine transport system permease subunit